MEAAPQNWVPLPYMRKAVKWLLEHRAAALFADPGLRKTSITYAAISSLKKAGLLRGALVVAPRLPAQLVWPAEQRKWAQFADLKVVLLHGKDKDKLAYEQADVYVVTYDGFRWLADGGHLKRLFKAKKLCTLVYDELHKMKSTASVRFKTIKKWLPQFDRRWGLTGSPASNNLLDLFGQVYSLDMGSAFGPYITHFRNAFFVAEGKYRGDPFPVWQPQAGAEERIYALLKNVVLRIDGRDYLDLPKLIYIPHRFDLPPAVRTQYAKMEREMWTLAGDAVFTAKTAASVSQKCRQITSGALYYDVVDPLTGAPRARLRAGKREWEAIHSEKIELLQALVEELQGQQLLVAYEYVHEADRIRAAFGKDTPCIGGGTSDKKTAEYERAWNAGAIPLMMGHPDSMGLGLNFQGSNAHHVAWFSGTWNLALYEQLIGRLKRSGNTAKHVFVHHLIANDTIDEAVFATPQRKRAVQMKLLDALKH